MQKSKKKLLEQALKIFETHYGKDHVEVAKTLNNVGDVYRSSGNAHKSKELLERALKIFETHYGKEHIFVAKTLNNLANAYGDLEDAKEQKILLERALKIQEAHYGKEHVEVANIVTNLADAYGALGDAKKKKELLEHTLNVFEAHYGKKHIQVAKILDNLGITYGILGDAHMSEIFFQRALKIKETHYKMGHVDVAKTLFNLGATCLQQENLNESKNYMQKAYDIFIKYPNCGENHPLTQKAKQTLDEINKKLPKSQKEVRFSGKLFTEMFNKTAAVQANNQLDTFLKKYNLPDSSKLSLEKCLRMAATNNKAEDIDILLKARVNINAQDNGGNKKTALHWAVIKQAKRCIKKLLDSGAQFNIADANGKTAYDYAKEVSDREIPQLFLVQELHL